MLHFASLAHLRPLSPSTMILRSILLLGLGVAQPAGPLLASGSMPTQTVKGPAADEIRVSAREALAREFASWRMDLLTQGESPSALTSLTALVARGESLVEGAPEDAAGIELLTELYAEEFDQSERRLDLTALRSLFLRRLRAAHDPGSDAGVAAMAQAAAVVVTLERIERLVSAPLTRQGGAESVEERRRAGPRAQMIAAAVRDALDSSDAEFIRSLGSEAGEALSEAAFDMTGERGPGSSLNPLELLVAIDPRAALDVALVHVRSEDLLLKLAVVEAFVARNPFAREEVWEGIPGGAFELVNPDWAEIVQSLYQAPRVPVADADRFLLTFAQRGYAPLSLPSLLPGCLKRRPLGQGPAWPVAVEAAQELLASNDPEAQRAGLRVVLLSDSIVPALGLMASPNRRLRELLARAFGPRKVGNDVLAPTLDADYQGALRTFLEVVEDATDRGDSSHDPMAAALRLAAESAPADGPPLVAPETLIKVLSREPLMTPAALQAALLHLAPLGDRERFGVLEAASGTILRAMDSSDASWQGQMPVAAKALFGAAVKTGDGEAFIGVFVDGADADDWRRVIEIERLDGGSTEYSPYLRELSPALQMDMLRALWRVGYDKFIWLDEDHLSLRRDHWLELAADPRLPRPARIWALEAMAGEKTSPAPPNAAAELASIVATLGELPFSSRDMALMGTDPEEYMNHLLDRPNAADETVLGVYIELEKDSTVNRLLERFPPSTWYQHRDSPALAAVLGALVKRRDPTLNETLMAANISRAPIQSYLLKALSAERYVGHLPLGGAILKAGAIEQDLAIHFVSGFMTDDAARHLVEAMGAADSESYREKLFAALQGLTERRAVAEKWLRSSDAAERHDAAVRGLISVIEGGESTEEARLEAIKGLGLLDARDELPRLIDLLDAGDESQKKAARAAIERMSR